MDSYWIGSSSDRMSHDDTPLRNSQQRYLESQDQKTPYYNEAPEDKGNTSLDINDAPTVRHIIIPVDMRALDDKNPKITLLKSDLFQKLGHYGEHIFPNNDQHETKPALEKNADYLRRTIIPSFPVYSQAAVNTNGVPNLDSKGLKNANEIYDDLRVRFENQEYEVRFINNEQIAFINNKRYGWLKVIGDGMNKSTPILINDGDYVLFSEIHDVTSCIQKIVVAGLPEIDIQMPQLVIKRLLKLNTQYPSKTKSLRIKSLKFMLHSESSLDKDPQTGISYKKDIEIINDYQIVGEAIAIAKTV